MSYAVGAIMKVPLAARCGNGTRLRAILLGSIALAVIGATAAAAEPIRIVAFGDSNTAGFGVPRKDAYPAKLERALRAMHHDVRVTNAGINGDTTLGAIKRLEASVPQDAKIAIVEFATNDRRAGVKPERIRTNLATIVRRLRLFELEVLLAGYRWADFSDIARAHDALYFQWGAPRKSRFYIRGNPGNHLNAAGYDVVVARIVPQIETLIARVRSRR
jgi:acyl-CoA thioesterase I